MRVLGIDPGLSRCGYGALDATGPGGRGARAVAVGVLRTAPTTPHPERLAELQRELRALVDELRPDAVAVEKVFFQSNVRTAIGVAQASGIAIAEAVNAGALVAEYTPNQVKEAVAGWGGASKDEVERMVRTLLGLDRPLRPIDAADAAALALCHLAHAPRLAQIARLDQLAPVPAASGPLAPTP
ncbi:MAG: crossover junction endodeoxyribonuclease RuvC [Acidimicrobiia bacterium]|nr:crossover junction endodeoxyribonuclease RuvC [Acidimicrobiia bacterium]